MHTGLFFQYKIKVLNRVEQVITVISGQATGAKLMSIQVSIGQVKREISDLVNRVSYAGERIILTSRGKPKAALVSLEDYERLLKSDSRATDIEKWLADTRALSSKIEKRRNGPIDVDSILDASQNEL
jgi:prevent-host-death family protein